MKMKEIENYNIFNLAASPCGKYLVGACGPSYDVQKCAETFLFSGHRLDVSDEWLICWELKEGPKAKLVLKYQNIKEDIVNCISFSNSMEYMVCSTAKKCVYLWRFGHSEMYKVFDNLHKRVASVCFSFNSQFLLFPNYNKIFIWDLENCTEVNLGIILEKVRGEGSYNTL